MAAIVIMAHHNQDGGPSRPHKQTSIRRDSATERMVQDTVQNFTSGPTSDAAVLIQRAVGRKLLGRGVVLRRKPLLERMTLELEMMRGLRGLFLCAAMFCIVIFASVLETQGPRRLGLVSTYESLFELGDGLAEIKTTADLFDYLRSIARQSRAVMPLSSDNFVEDSSQLKILEGSRQFRRTIAFNTEEIDPRVSSPSFSIVVWSQIQPGKGGPVIRKALGASTEEKELSCWKWYEGSPTSSFSFGAHDFRGYHRSGSLPEETAIGTHASESDDGKWHLLALVVTSSSVSFYKDAQLLSSVPIMRPVTDCSGNLLEIGSENIPRMAELTFFARQLTPTEMREIAVAGFTLQSLAAGKMPTTPTPTPVDDLASQNKAEVAELISAQRQLASAIEVESVLSRAVTEIENAAAMTAALHKSVLPPVSAACAADQWFPGSSCHIIQDVPGSVRTDEIGYSYHEMLPPSVRDGAAHDDRLYFTHSRPGEWVTYNSSTFPRFCGTSASFTFWLRAEAAPHAGYLLTRYDKGSSSQRWGLFVNSFGLDVYSNRFEGDVVHVMPEQFTNLFTRMPVEQGLRHAAYVFDAAANEIRTYVDGSLIDSTVMPPGTIADLDCGDYGQDPYIGLGHRIPGGWPMTSEFQDFRFYTGTALTDEEVRQIAFPSSDPSATGPQRKCQTKEEGGDSTFSDLLGHPCSWYQEKRATVPTICQSEDVKRECPLACQSIPSCFESNSDAPEAHTVFERVMHLEEKSINQGLLCVRKDLEDKVVDKCKELRAQQDPLTYPVGWDIQQDPTDEIPWQVDPRWPGGSGGWHKYFRPQIDINVTDCELLEEVVNPFCSWDAPNDWATTFNDQVKASNQLTVSMWVKILGDEMLTTEGAYRTGPWKAQPRRILFLSSVTPPKHFMEFSIMPAGTIGLIKYPDGEAWQTAMPAVSLEKGRWIHLAISVGVTDPFTGSRAVIVLVDSTAMFDDVSTGGVPWEWDVPEGDEFLQAIQFPGDVLVSPIEFMPTALSLKELQARFYNEKTSIALRRGPRRADRLRLTSTIDYDRAAYAYPIVLVAPPLLFQTRKTPTAECVNKYSTTHLRTFWENTVNGVTCSPPFECPESVLSDVSGLLSCASPELPETFFGRSPLTLDGKEQFYEFLQSIADGSILVRGEEEMQTTDFIDGLTSDVSIAMVAYAPSFGIASTIQIKATLTTDVKLDFAVEHFQALEGADLDNYRLVVFLGIAVAILILLDKGLGVWELKGTGAQPLGPSLYLDLVIQVLLPILYFIIRYLQVQASADAVAETIGEEGLSGVPWASTEVPLEDKLQSFFDGVEAFNAKIRVERSMKVFYFVYAIVCLLRLIAQGSEKETRAQTSVHPRLSILVGTLREACGDLWHFLLLLMVLYGGFLALALAMFSGQRKEFATTLSTFETLYDMMLGSLPESGDVPSQFWAYDPLIMVFALAYNFFVFFIMLNFIIAIIVEGYMKVVAAIQEQESEQEFITDCTAVCNICVKRLVNRWPSHTALTRRLRDTAKVQLAYSDLRKLFPGWHPKSLRSLLEHYNQYDFMRPDSTPRHQAYRYSYLTPDAGVGEGDLKLCDAVDEIERRTALMLNRSVPSLLEKVAAANAVDVEYRARKAKTGKASKPAGRAASQPSVASSPLAAALPPPTLPGRDAELEALKLEIRRLSSLVASSLPQTPAHPASPAPRSGVQVQEPQPTSSSSTSASVVQANLAFTTYQPAPAPAAEQTVPDAKLPSATPLSASVPAPAIETANPTPPSGDDDGQEELGWLEEFQRKVSHSIMGTGKLV